MKRTFVSVVQQEGEARTLVVAVQAAGEGQRVTWQWLGDSGDHSADVVLRQAPNGDWLVQRDGIVRPLRLSVDRDTAWLTDVTAQLDRDQTTRWRRVEASRGRGGAGEAQIRSPMTGRVVQLAVQPGDTVQKGAVLVVVEAMKMEHALKAPRAATVAKVRCTVGELVEGGQELVELQEAT
jgi:biotin carboxyl carrier protein